MLEKLIKPYRVIVPEKARIAGLEDRTFPNKKSAREYVKRVRSIDPQFNPSFAVVFRYIDTATGQLYLTRGEYEQEQERCIKWQKQRKTAE